MSMEDILKVLVNSRQQGSQSQQAADPMADLIGNLLGGEQTTRMGQQSQMPQQQSGGLGDMMGLLEKFMGGNQSGGANQIGTNNPIMLLIQPFVEKLAKKMNIPPQIATIVVSFVAHKLLSHHPTSGRDSNSFNLDDMLKQMSNGKIDTNILQNSGMVNELSRSTGLDQATAAKSLEEAFGMFGKQVQGGMRPSASNLKSSGASRVGGGRVSSMKSRGGKINRNKG